MNDINAVAMMRRIRDDLDRKMQGMTWEEKREFIRPVPAGGPTRSLLRCCF